MANDSYLEEILKRLAGTLDPDVFEDCAADVLQSIYPTLVLLPGGRDSGRDALLASDREDADFLVCTTQKDPVANLRKSLRSHRAHLKPGNRVIFATSQSLDSNTRDRLRETATTEGYTLVQGYDRNNLAHLMYRRPEWCRRLLDLTGEPPSLSKIPKSDRPLGGGPVIGREEEVAWLRKASGDCVLSGQPGSGKTFLLYELCADEDLFFVVGGDIGRIADEIRKKKPAGLIVDDAHAHLELLRSLVHFRKENEGAFGLVATCWPAEQKKVASVLQAGAEARELERLTRDQIVEVIKAAGIAGPPEFVAELVNQADGRPGLAVTLCHICLRGRVRDVTLGDALAQDTRRTVEPLGAEAYHLLAGLAIGGDAGMELVPTAQVLGLPPSSALTMATGMAAGGVLYQVGETRLTVRPHALRHALVRDVFFGGALAIPHADLIALAPNPAEVAMTLSGARARRGRVPIDLIMKQAELGKSSAALATLAWVGPEEARAALSRHPECLIDLARPCLEHVPEDVIPDLLGTAVDDKRELHQATEHSLRILGDWIRAGEPGSGAAVRRRQILHRASLAWLMGGGDVETGVRSLLTALTPKFDSHAPDPGSGLRVTIRFGSITAEEARQVGALWPATLNYLQGSTGWTWPAVQALVDKWCHPGQLGPKVPAEILAAIRTIGEGMLRDLVPLASDDPGLQKWILATADQIGAAIEIELDPSFLTLYPIERTFEQSAYEKQDQAARALAREWASGPAIEVVARIIRFAAQADKAQIRFPRYDQPAWWELAKHVDDPLAWGNEVIAQSGHVSIFLPFLHYSSAKSCEGWAEVARTCLDSDYKHAAADVIFEAGGLPVELVEQAAASITGSGDWVEAGSIQNRYTEPSLRALLRHEDRAVAGATAMGIWHRAPKHRVPQALLSDWRFAVVHCVEEDHDLESAFQAYEGLALEWLRVRIDERSSTLYLPRGSIDHAIRHLTADERRDILKSIDGSDYVFQGLISALVDDDPPLLKALLEHESLRPMHLEPLRGKPDESWIARALLALEGGYTPEDLVEASYSCGHSWAGNRSEMWQEWVEAFARLEAHNDQRIAVIGRVGGEQARREREQALREERERDVFGR